MMKKLVITGVSVVLTVMICQARSERGLTKEVYDFVEKLQESIKRGEMTEQEMRLEVEVLARKHRELADTVTFPKGTPLSTTLTPDVEQCRSALWALRKMGDRQSLPLFEEISLAEHWLIRADAISAYIKVAGPVDALPFIDRIEKRTASSYNKRFDRTGAYLTLGELTYNEWVSPEVAPFVSVMPRTLPVLSPEDKKKVSSFALEKIQTEKDGRIIEVLDQILCEHLADYKTSVQRLAMAERFPEGNYWKAAKEEIEKIPANERKDFRAKSELLDPERKEE